MDISKMRRQDIRYALQRCRNGNAEPEHEKVLEFYQERLEKLSLTVDDFTVKWDVKKEDVGAIVTGAWVQVYKEEVTASLFDSSGSLI